MSLIDAVERISYLRFARRGICDSCDIEAAVYPGPFNEYWYCEDCWKGGKA